MNETGLTHLSFIPGVLLIGYVVGYVQGMRSQRR